MAVAPRTFRKYLPLRCHNHTCPESSAISRRDRLNVMGEWIRESYGEAQNLCAIP